MRKRLLLGLPGAGKTHRLVEAMEAAIDEGVPPSQVALVSFTNAAVDEARERACARFGLGPKELPYFRTTHSLAFRELGLRPSDVLSDDHLAELSAVTGELSSVDPSFEAPAAGMSADVLLTVDHYARAALVTLEEAWRVHGGDVDWHRLKRFSSAYRAYKEDRGLVDFTDMLSAYAASGAGAAPVRRAFVDEAQDLTLLQHAAIAKAFAGAEEVVMAGDDDQAIHAWAGAARDRFLSMDDFVKEVIPLTRRLPRAVFEFSQGVVRRIKRRYPKEVRCGERAGSVSWVVDPSEADLGSGSWLLLARTRAQLVELAAAARSQGVVYSTKGATSVDAADVRAIVAHERLRAGKECAPEEARAALRAAGSRARVPEDRPSTAASLGHDASGIWHDALLAIPLDRREYYLACMRRGEDLRAPPRVRVETIHGSKGLEAENVLLVTDMTRRTWTGYELDPDSESRVFYVGATRASEALTIVAPRGPLAYPL